jgi:hypothetical protein
MGRKRLENTFSQCPGGLAVGVRSPWLDLGFCTLVISHQLLFCPDLFRDIYVTDRLGRQN